MSNGQSFFLYCLHNTLDNIVTLCYNINKSEVKRKIVTFVKMIIEEME